MKYTPVTENAYVGSMASGKTARLCDIVNIAKPKVVIPFGHPARHFPSYNTLPIVNTPIPHESTLHGSRRPSIAMDMSVLMCACRILIDDPLYLFPDYPFSHFLERKIGEFIHVANVLWSEYLIIWGLRNLCTDTNVFRFLKLLQIIQLGTTTPWGHLQDILLHRNGKLSSHTIYGFASVEWHNGMPKDFQECRERARMFQSLESAFWDEQYMMHGAVKSRTCVFCGKPVKKFHPDTHSYSLSVDLMPCCLATAHRECVYGFVYKSWICPHEDGNRMSCLHVRECILDPSINPWDPLYCTKMERCPRCTVPYVQARPKMCRITPPISQYLTEVRSHMRSVKRLYKTVYGADCVFRQIKKLAKTIHNVT